MGYEHLDQELEDLRKENAELKQKLAQVWEVFHLLDDFVGGMPTARGDLLGKEGYKKYKKLMGYDEEDNCDEECEDDPQPT